MAPSTISVGSSTLSQSEKPVSGSFVNLQGGEYYRIENSDQMSPFLMSIVSDSDHWMFISSNGALTAGRKDPDNALFPYVTDDKIHDSQELTGGKSLFLVRCGHETFLWEPFSERYQGLYRVDRNLYKSRIADSVRFEEINHDIGLTFWYEWCTSEKFGFVKRSGILNNRGESVSVRILDGLRNILPYGVDSRLQMERSTLVDAYKKTELHTATGLCLVSLSSMLVDKPEPAETLQASTVFSVGLSDTTTLLSLRQFDTFRRGGTLVDEEDIRAERGAYFVHSSLTLAPGVHHEWYLVAEINQDSADVADLMKLLSGNDDVGQEIQSDVERGTRELRRVVASADGIQTTGDALSDARHYCNVLFNVMRGGLFEGQYAINPLDFGSYLQAHNKSVFNRLGDNLLHLPNPLPLSALSDWVSDQGDPQLTRLAGDYLPLSFSRRHGDPSRPWNTFSIETRTADGTPKLNFEGNWRDIFQNWEALVVSYPEYTSNVLSKFLNASTADGYNPYRITRDGIDWEVVDPSDPWSHIGYWGDHQIIYLLKLLEITRSHFPGKIEQHLCERRYSFANVPYRIAPFSELWNDPHRTIQFDSAKDELSSERVRLDGADGKLVWDENGNVLLVSMAEKLLISVLAKLSNFIPGAGIWMNTQRPEWNDANNALVGFGVSMVTLCYLRRFQQFARTLFKDSPFDDFDLSIEVADFLLAISTGLNQFAYLLTDEFSDTDRKRVLVNLGESGSDYRHRVYTEGFSGQTRSVPRRDLISFFDISILWLDHSIRLNQRTDGLYHAYNVISTNEDSSLPFTRLYEMLEGQVAILSSGLLDPAETVELLAALKKSALYRADQHSYILYPDRKLPRFQDKNRIPSDRIAKSSLVQKLKAAGDRRLLAIDSMGDVHFKGSIHNARDVDSVLTELQQDGYRKEVQDERGFFLQLFESLFDHQSFTGRSGTFFGYEGLGCIYWHMVSKLLLAVNESIFDAHASGTSTEILKQLTDDYYEIRAGLGQNKTPAEYGAFPMDPYSHTPRDSGAQQPGMTGQVKEDILARWSELGIRVSGGAIGFVPILLRQSEFVSESKTFSYVNVDHQENKIDLHANSMAFTYCQIPIIHHLSDEPRILITSEEGITEAISGLKLDKEKTAQLFSRSGQIRRIDVFLTPGL